MSHMVDNRRLGSRGRAESRPSGSMHLATRLSSSNGQSSASPINKASSSVWPGHGLQRNRHGNFVAVQDSFKGPSRGESLPPNLYNVSTFQNVNNSIKWRNFLNKKKMNLKRRAKRENLKSQTMKKIKKAENFY